VFAGRDAAKVLTSPSGRATETAQLAGLDAEPDADLLEWDYGDYEGRTATEIRRERPGWVLWTDGAPNGEAPADVAARADRVIARALDADGPVVLVAHGHLLRTVAVRWIEQPMELGARLQLGPGRLGVLGVERTTRVLRAWSAARLT
jgi:probable phosphoglycerate mutase